MPIPNKGESKEHFIQRFMESEEGKRDYPDEKQRYAVAESKWEQHVNKSVYTNESVYKDNVLVTKSVDEEQLVFGWANIAVDVDGEPPTDFDDDVASPGVIEKAAYNFVLKYRESGVMHEGDVTGYLVESVMFTKAKMDAIGIPEGSIPQGWWVGFYIPDKELFNKVKSGEYKMFSIQGKAKRVTV